MCVYKHTYMLERDYGLVFLCVDELLVIFWKIFFIPLQFLLLKIFQQRISLRYILFEDESMLWNVTIFLKDCSYIDNTLKLDL